MKTFLLRAFSFWAAIFVFYPAIRAADTNPPPRLTVELRDGSRVVGSSVEKNFRFHSALLGEIKLDVKDIRSVECVSSNAVKLTTANGDSLTVSFVDSQFAVKTSFGKVDLQVNSVRKFSVSAGRTSGAHPPGLVALWSGEGDGNDSAGGNDAILSNVSFAEGKVGQAFSLVGNSSYAEITYRPVLNVGEAGGLTIAAWIKPLDVSGFHLIIEYDNTTDTTINEGNGVSLWLGRTPGSQGVLVANIVGVNGLHHFLQSAQGTIVNGSFQHVVLTYNKAKGMGFLYVNGVVVAQGQWDGFTPLTEGDLWISRRPFGHPGDWTYNSYFAGLLDEVSIYNRALSAEEIKSICIEDNDGELPPPPSNPNPQMPSNGIYRSNFSE